MWKGVWGGGYWGRMTTRITRQGLGGRRGKNIPVGNNIDQSWVWDKCLTKTHNRIDIKPTNNSYMVRPGQAASRSGLDFTARSGDNRRETIVGLHRTPGCFRIDGCGGRPMSHACAYIFHKQSTELQTTAAKSVHRSQKWMASEIAHTGVGGREPSDCDQPIDLAQPACPEAFTLFYI